MFAVAIALCAMTGVALADGPWLPDNFSTIGEDIDHLYRMIFYLVAVLFFGTEAALLFFIIRFRRREGHKASYIHENNVAETIWSVIPGIILIVLAVYQWNTWAEAKLRPPNPDESVRVQILAKQFEWRIRYAGPDGQFSTDDDLTTTNQLYIPDKKSILIQIRAEDVIHSFFLPNHRVKQDVVPGTTVLLWFDAKQTGKYEIACAELCGLGHYRMKGYMHVQTASEFESWLTSRAEEGFAPGDWGWDWEEGI